MFKQKNKTEQSPILLWAEELAYAENRVRIESKRCKRRGCGEMYVFHVNWNPVVDACPEFMEKEQ